MTGPDDATFLPWRVAQLEQWRRDLEQEANPIVMARDIRDMRAEFRAVKRLLWALLVSSISAGVTVIITVLTHAGGH